MSDKNEEVSFIWEGLDKRTKKVTGEITAPSEAAAKTALRKQGINPTKLKKKSKPLFGAKGKIETKDITVFSRQLATMMSAGVPLVQSFEIVGRGHENPAMQRLILSVKGDVEAGGSLTEALGKHPEHFSDLYVNLVRAGEQAGILEDILHKVSTYLEKFEALKSKVKSALGYPIAVIVVAVVITMILMIFVIPQFESLFQGFGADLPALTRIVINMSSFVVNSWYLMLGLVVLIIISFVQAMKRSEAFANSVDRALLRVPVIGDIINKSCVARFSRTLATMFAAGTPLVEAMSSVAGATGNIVYYEATMKMKDEIATGTQLQASMRETGLFPNMVVQMVAIGEESGAIDTMLGKVADWYEQEVDDAVEALTSLLEPMIMAFLGVVIGGIVVGMYLPIFKMGAVV